MKEEKPSEDMEMLLRQLVCNDSISMAGRALQLYACRCLKMDKQAASAFVLQYFEEVFPKELERYRNKQKRPKRQFNQ